MFTFLHNIAKPLAESQQNALAASLTDKDHPQATSCKPIYHGKPVICNFCSHSAKPAWRLQTKWYGKLCWNIVQGADEVGTESFFVSVDLLIHSEQYANTSMAVLIKRVTCKSSFFFFLGTKKSFKLRNLPSRPSTLFLSRRSACPFLNCDQVSSRFTEYSRKLTFHTLCSRKVRYWEEIYVLINVS